ncbi:unnamed protein product [Rotaria socialis]|uniref:Uncharacterized protein n=1 Tax=Rotaria socialis TaxID=392032 RepID=A0A820QNY0_9BILA|nr:unnamed protein product [Rotaria socialis]CAF4308035.1 unnamed protein product [Rotaria socialis]CAF4424400.1 unnamed protein product [Rotaria socialis]CAF4485048.1 unnamed protein product [Rotaria socialis]CAF4815914.1 unnamed protein product [Rotaria socialis]
MATSSIINFNMNNNNHSKIQSENTMNSTVIARIEFPNQQPQQSNDDKLQLKNAWGTYFYKADKQRDWKQNVIYITSISYIEDFWSFYTHTYGLRDLSNGSDYMLFKKKRWEDVSSRGGGKWIVTIDPKRRKHDLDGYWLHLMLLLIGDMFDAHLSTYINGAIVSLRVKGDRLALWLKKIDDLNIIKSIGNKFKDLLNIPADIQIIYEYHETKFDDFNNEIRLII